jgi:hypothetical protein
LRSTTKADFKRVLTKGKVVFAGVAGDKGARGDEEQRGDDHEDLPQSAGRTQVRRSRFAPAAR